MRNEKEKPVKDETVIIDGEVITGTLDRTFMGKEKGTLLLHSTTASDTKKAQIRCASSWTCCAVLDLQHITHLDTQWV